LSAHLQLEKVLSQEIKSADLGRVLEELDLPLIPVLTRMELHGVCIDGGELSRQSAGLAEDIKRFEKQVHALAGGTFNISSPKQLAEVLFQKLKLPPTKKTKTGFSTDSDVLEALKDKHPIAAQILDYRELTKLKSTYVDALPSLTNSATGHVHTQLNQTWTTTGRLSAVIRTSKIFPFARSGGGRFAKPSFRTRAIA